MSTLTEAPPPLAPAPERKPPRRRGRLVPGADVVLHWSPVHTFGLDAAQDIEAGIQEETAV